MHPRELEIVADSDEFYRSTLIPLDGKEAKRTFELDYPSAPSGDYEVSATLTDDKGHVRAFTRQSVFLVGSGFER